MITKLVMYDVNGQYYRTKADAFGAERKNTNSKATKFPITELPITDYTLVNGKFVAIDKRKLDYAKSRIRQNEKVPRQKGLS